MIQGHIQDEEVNFKVTLLKISFSTNTIEEQVFIYWMLRGVYDGITLRED